MKMTLEKSQKIVEAAISKSKELDLKMNIPQLEMGSILY